MSNLVVQYKEPQQNIHEKLLEILDFYDGEQKTFFTNGEMESIRFFWRDVPSKQLADIARRLGAEGVEFKIFSSKIEFNK